MEDMQNLSEAEGKVEIKKTSWIRVMKKHVMTMAFLTIAGSHLSVANATRMKVLIVLSLGLAFDNVVLAIGALPVPRAILEYLGRIRYFVQALVWPYFLSYAFELGRLCDYVTVETAEHWELLLTSIAIFATLVFIGRELMWFWQGPPLSMTDSAELPKFGDCMAANSIFGGVFGINKHEAVDDRIVFIPMPERAGVAVPSGICVLEHLCMGLVAWTEYGHPAMFACALVAVMGRLGTNIKQDGKRTVLGRLLPRIGEALWLTSCLWQESCKERGTTNIFAK